MDRRSTTRIRRATVIALSLGVALLGACGDDTARAVSAESPLLDPADPAFQTEAPGTFRAHFETSQGDFVVEVVREWAPRGADRFYNLARHGFYDDARFFRAIEGFMVQFGIHGDPAVTDAWADERIPDDPVLQSNQRGNVTFAMGGPDTRTTQVYINLVDNAQLDGMGFAPFGQVVEGMDVVDQLYTGYGEGAPNGTGPAQALIREEGNAYLLREFPRLDHVVRVSVEP